MSYGIRAAARTQQTTRPVAQGPDVAGGGGGGGGTAPTAPSDVTAPTPANTVISWGGTGHAYLYMSAYTGGRDIYLYDGHMAMIGYLDGYGGTNAAFKGTTAAGDATPGVYDLQRCYEGLPSATGNGNASGLGLFKAKQAGSVTKTYLKFYMAESTKPTPGPFGDMSNGTLVAGVAAKVGNVVLFCKNFGANGIGFDLENGNWDTPKAGMTEAQWMAVQEAFGYAVGQAIWQNWPACELNIYSLQFYGSWHQIINDFTGGINYPATSSGAGVPNANSGRVQFFFGLCRAHMDFSGTGKIRWMDHWWYNFLSQRTGVTALTALQQNAPGTLAGISQSLAPAVWSHIAPLFKVCTFSWAGGSPGFQNAHQEGEPLWTQNQEIYRHYSMDGVRFDYNGPDNSPDGLWFRPSTSGLWNGHDNYTFPTGRLAGMAAAKSASTSYSTVAPVVAATPSGSGSTRTLAGTASHPQGIARIKAYLYPSGTPVYAQMTQNLGGGSFTTNINNQYMDWTVNLTGVASGNYAIVTAYSIQEQEHSVVVAL